MAKKIEKKKVAKKKLVTLDDIKTSALADLTKDFEYNKKILAKSKTSFEIEDTIEVSSKTAKLIDRYFDQEEDSK